MKEKIITLFNKSVSFVKKNFILSISVAIAIAVITTVIILVCTLGKSEDSKEHDDWGNGITENIPKFDGKCDAIEKNGNDYCAAYYSDVTGNEISEYVSELESVCKISFSGDKYPRSAVYEDKIIAIHYNVTEKKFSITVVSKANENNK